MPRNRVKLAYITDDVARKATYKKRKKGLVKKVSELSTLCGVKACAVIYSHTCDSQPEVWPSAATAHRILSDFKALPAVKRTDRSMSQENLIMKRIAQVDARLNRLREENNKKKLTQVMFENLGGNSLNNVKRESLDDLSLLIDENLNNIDNKLHMLVEASVSRET